MGHLGFTVRDYATGSLVGAPPADDLWVVVPRLPSTAPPLVERPSSSVRLRDRRLYFPTTRNAQGDVIVIDVPAGSYDAGFFATGYVRSRASVTAPLAEPLLVRLHRDASYPFGAEDTLIEGDVVRTSGAPTSALKVRFVDLTEDIPRHEVPVNDKGQFVIFVPEKRTPGPVELYVLREPLILVVIAIPAVLLGRRNVARQQPNSSIITVP